MELVSDYMRDDTLRHALSELAKKTFWIDFEDWVTGGYLEGDYIPYSFMEDGKIISNVYYFCPDCIEWKIICQNGKWGRNTDYKKICQRN